MVDPWRDRPQSSLHSQNLTTAGVLTVLLTSPSSRKRKESRGPKTWASGVSPFPGPWVAPVPPCGCLLHPPG